MSSGSKSLHSSVLQWAHGSSSSHHPFKPSSPLVSDKPKEAPAPQQAQVVGGPRRGVRRVREKKEKLRLSLTEEEIAEDLYSMTGGIATRKTNKRPQSVKKEIDKLFPGSSLEGLSADTYCAERCLQN